MAKPKKFNLTNILMYQVQSEPKIYDLLTEQAEQEHQDWAVMSGGEESKCIQGLWHHLQPRVASPKYAKEIVAIQLQFWL